MPKLRAVKSLTYATRRLLPGDIFETVKDRDARVLLATRKVETVRAEVPIPPPPPAVKAKIEAAVDPGRPVPPHGSGPGNPSPESNAASPPVPAPPPHVDDDLLKARAEYREVVGRAPFHAWDLATLREKIAAAKAAQ